MSGKVEELERKISDLTFRVFELQEREKTLNLKLMRKSAEASEASEALKRIKLEWELVAEQKGHNLCWKSVAYALKKTIGRTGNYPDPETVSGEQFAHGCVGYHKDIFPDCGVKLEVVSSKVSPKIIPATSGTLFGRKAIFLDRDGTVIQAIQRPDHIKSVTCPFTENELCYVPDVNEALAIAREAGFLRILVTNQPDPRHGYMDENEWNKIHRRVINDLDLDDFVMCRHTGDEGCEFKKPSGLMLRLMADKHGIDLSKSYMIGDSWKDMDAGHSAGCRRVIMLNTSYNVDEEGDDVRASSLKEAIQFILSDK